MSTPFGAILQRAVERTPGAVVGAFAASDGELVDQFATADPEHAALITAHYGVVLANLVTAAGACGLGAPQLFVAQHADLDVVVAAVADGYYALLAMRRPAALAAALDAVETASAALRQEMA